MRSGSWATKKSEEKSYIIFGALSCEVHIEELFIGGPEEQKRGRSKRKKRLVIVALEKVKDVVGSIYAQIIENASSEEFKPFFKSYRGYFHIASLVI